MAYFPLFINIEHYNVLVVGGGRIAERRIEALLPFDCKILVVSPDVTELIKTREAEGKISVADMGFSSFLSLCRVEDKFQIVLAAASDSQVNAAAAAYGRSVGAWVNRADSKEDSDFYFPGIVRRDPLVLGVTAGGKDHKLARRATEAVRTFIDRNFELEDIGNGKK